MSRSGFTPRGRGASSRECSRFGRRAHSCGARVPRSYGMRELSIPGMQHFVFKNTTMQQASPPTHAHVHAHRHARKHRFVHRPCLRRLRWHCYRTPHRNDSVGIAEARWMNAPSKQIAMPCFEPPYLPKKAQRSTLRLYQHMLQHVRPQSPIIYLYHQSIIMRV